MSLEDHTPTPVRAPPRGNACEGPGEPGGAGRGTGDEEEAGGGARRPSHPPEGLRPGLRQAPTCPSRMDSGSLVGFVPWGSLVPESEGAGGARAAASVWVTRSGDSGAAPAGGARGQNRLLLLLL